ncbi:coproporphyrinogen dehydrogenase HemZ [Christensenellaceae bacterium OttesenSCG-928-K19]|nr:coproporphyrinogen dehydrogenase HemZ [Christensenellaceae bacterium OttesenSCG-928-K19]
MFALYTDTPQFFSDLCDEVRLFENVKRIEKVGVDELPDGKVLRHFFLCSGSTWESSCQYYEDGTKITEYIDWADVPEAKDALTIKKLQKRLVKKTIYGLMKSLAGRRPPWGSLTGIRPTKLFRELAQQSGVETAQCMFRDEFDVSDEKTALAKRIVENQKMVMDSVADHDIDIYIGIPFCASRCKYCSFISRDIGRVQSMKRDYMEKLLLEISAAKEIVKDYTVRAVYIGGGTPTSLDASELKRLLYTINTAFGEVEEFTVEAGRPDTVTTENLQMIKDAGATRISVNTQTLKQHTLDLIGRKHSVQDFLDAFALARNLGFDNINTDIILGLPEEGPEDVQATLEGVCELAPENVTVHTLAIKNSSEFALEQKDSMKDAKLVESMVEQAEAFLIGEGYEPYYLYRQKYMSGNLENTGYAKNGAICRYNIDNMEELTSILALGAGGISKRIFDSEKRIERAANVKDIEHYIQRTDEMIMRKKELFAEISL